MTLVINIGDIDHLYGGYAPRVAAWNAASERLARETFTQTLTVHGSAAECGDGSIVYIQLFQKLLPSSISIFVGFRSDADGK